MLFCCLSRLLCLPWRAWRLGGSFPLMPIYQLDNRPLFPPPEHAEEDGLLAVGGDLSAPRLLEAYRNGIFPWYEPGEEILWWSPDPRLILEPERIKVSRSLRATIRKRTYEV